MQNQSNLLTAQAGITSVGAVFRQRALIDRHAIAVVEGDKQLSFGELNERVNRLAHVLTKLGLQHGDRLALLTRNCTAYVEVELAAAKLGVIVAAINWRLAAPELAHCIRLAEPRLLLVAADYVETVARLNLDIPPTVTLGEEYESHLKNAAASEPNVTVNGEDGLIIIYTSGTTGLPKGALISHRAMLARAMVFGLEMGLPPDDAFVAWPPFFHMASTDQGLATLLRGGPVIIVDGYDPEAFLRIIEQHRIGWLALIPGMIENFLTVLKQQPVTPRGIRLIGAMADLVAAHHIAEITELLQAPYVNTFGATETGLPPATAALIPVGTIPDDLAKRQSSFCEVRLVDENDNEVPDGEPGECAIRGPTLFSGYWRAPEVNAKDFRNGWFHMGDVFSRRPDGRLVFMDRAKYMIKSGGENIYPAEIERVLLADARIDDAVVVRRSDDRWGEVPVAAVACNDPTLTADQLLGQCRQQLASYKQPKEIRFVPFADLPRSTTGKIQRHEVEQWFKPTTQD